MDHIDTCIQNDTWVSRFLMEVDRNVVLRIRHAGVSRGSRETPSEVTCAGRAQSGGTEVAIETH